MDRRPLDNANRSELPPDANDRSNRADGYMACRWLESSLSGDFTAVVDNYRGSSVPRSTSYRLEADLRRLVGTTEPHLCRYWA